MPTTNKPPHTFLRRRGDSKIWYIRDGSIVKSTGYAEAQRDEAERALRDHIRRCTSRPAAGSPSTNISIMHVIDEATDISRSQLAEGSLRKRDFARIDGRLRTVSQHWRGLTIGDFNQTSADNYIVNRILMRKPNSDEGYVSENTAILEIKTLRAAIYAYIQRYQLTHRPSVTFKHATPLVGNVLTRTELCRLLLACRCYKWNQEKGKMIPPKATGGLSRKRAVRKHIARLILLCAYAGLTLASQCRLRWTDSGDGDRSYIDMDHQPPLLYRLGKDACQGKLKNVPIFMGSRISNHLRRWFKADMARSRIFVIEPSYCFQEMIDPPLRTIRKVFTEAGLSADLTFSDIRYSAGFYLAKSRVSTFSSSILLGMPAQEFHVKYEHLRPDYQEDAVKALSKHRRTVGGL